MKRAWILLTGLAVLAAPSAAGEHPKCEMEVTACIRQMVDYVQQKGWIGIEIHDDEGGPARITKVVAGSPAEEAGFQVGDEFLALEGVRYEAMKNDEEQMRRTKQALRPGNRVTFTVGRGGREVDVVVRPIEVPQHILAQWVGQHVIDQHLTEQVAGPDEPTDSDADSSGSAAPSPPPG